jgi:serine phosphatase RsbU (regulator of sigma subunit)
MKKRSTSLLLGSTLVLFSVGIADLSATKRHGDVVRDEQGKILYTDCTGSCGGAQGEACCSPLTE